MLLIHQLQTSEVLSWDIDESITSSIRIQSCERVMSLKSSGRIRIVVICCLALFMAMLDNLVVNVAMPSIQTGLHASVSQLEWIVNAYTLAFVVMMLPFSSLADRYGRRGMFMIGITLFTLGSAASALASTPVQLELSRAVQGFGSAAIVPLTLAFVSDAFPPQSRAVAMGVVSGISGLGLTVGPLVGGIIVNDFAWPMIFWLNVPVGLLALALTPFWLPRRTLKITKRLDIVGFSSVSLGLFGLVWGLTRGNTDGWSSTGTWLPMALGVVLLIGFFWWERRVSDPFVNLSLFRRNQYATINGSGFWMFAGVFGAIFLLTLFLQEALGYSALGAGAREMYWTAATMFAAIGAGMLVKRFHHKRVMFLGFLLLTLSLAYFASVIGNEGTSIPFWHLIPPMIAAGIGMGLSMTPMNDGIMETAGEDEYGQASGMSNALRELGGVFGITIAGCIFQSAGRIQSPASFAHHLVPALWVCTAMMGLGLLTTLVIRSQAAQGRAAVLDT